MTTDTSRDAILNAGLLLALEWGESFGKPIHERLAARYRELTPEQLDELDRICRAAKDFGIGTFERMAMQSGRVDGVDQGAFVREVRERYPWIDDAGLARIRQQGQYYAWRDGAQ